MTGDPLLRVLFAAVFLLVGVRLLYLNWQEEMMARESKYWPITTGHIIYAGLKNYEPSRRARFGVNIVYEYSVRGTTYQSDRLEFGIGRYLNREDAQDIVAGHRPGKQIRVYYCPTNPQCATLRPGRPGIPFFVGYALIFAALAAGSFWVLNALGWLN